MTLSVALIQLFHEMMLSLMLQYLLPPELHSTHHLAITTIPHYTTGGNYKTGVAFGDCVQYGCDVAQEVTKFLTSDDTSEGISLLLDQSAAAAAAVEQPVGVPMSN